MQDTHFTVYVCVLFISLPIIKLAVNRKLLVNRTFALRGLAALVVSGIFFYLGLDDAHDPYRAMHGISQAIVGVALYYLWQCVPMNNYKKDDRAVVIPT